MEKTLLRDLTPDLMKSGGYGIEKVEGMTVDKAGNLFVVTDNDGVDDNSGETQFLALGKIAKLSGDQQKAPDAEGIRGSRLTAMRPGGEEGLPAGEDVALEALGDEGLDSGGVIGLDQRLDPGLVLVDRPHGDHVDVRPFGSSRRIAEVGSILASTA